MKKFWTILSVLYIPIYIAGWVMHIIARIILALSYFIMLKKRVGQDTIKSIFRWYGWH